MTSDFVCPWCYVGLVQLERALATRPTIETTLAHRSYNLHPYLPPEGLPRDELLVRKFGRSGPELFKRVERAGADVGIDFAFDRVDWVPTTGLAHLAVEFAAGRGKAHELTKRIFAAYFERGVRIDQRERLLEIGVEAGLQAEPLAEHLSQPGELDRVRSEAESARADGITAIPFFSIAGYPVPGAQSAETFGRVLDRVVARSAAS